MGPSVIPTTGARESSVSSSSRQGKPGNMKIGDLAMAILRTIETVRYYEREGLLPAPPRSVGNYRLYGPALSQD
jgi:hypothetical protein